MNCKNFEKECSILPIPTYEIELIQKQCEIRKRQRTRKREREARNRRRLAIFISTVSIYVAFSYMAIAYACSDPAQDNSTVYSEQLTFTPEVKEAREIPTNVASDAAATSADIALADVLEEPAAETPVVKAPAADTNAEPKTTNSDSMEIPAASTGFKAYMDYHTITNKRSMQYQLQQDAYTDGLGFRRYGDYYMVALGTYYADSCGKTFDITFESGTTIQAITGDIKADQHTDAKNQHRNGNVVEFIVDTDAMPSLARRIGDISYADPAFEGNIVSIVPTN